MSEKLQKVLARIGLGSRRYMEEVIAAGRVSVNESNQVMNYVLMVVKFSFKSKMKFVVVS